MSVFYCFRSALAGCALVSMSVVPLVCDVAPAQALTVASGPVAAPVTSTVAFNGIVNVLVLNNGGYSTVFTSPLTIVSIDTTGLKGVAKNLGDGRVAYNPMGKFNTLAAGQTATDTFHYTVADPQGRTATSTVTIVVTSGQNASAVTADFAQPVYSAKLVGTLLSLNQSNPTSSQLSQIQSKYWRQGDASLYSRAVTMGAQLEITLSEGWGYMNSTPAWGIHGAAPYGSATNPDFTAWDAYVTSVAKANKALSPNTVRYSIWNEPNWFYWQNASLAETSPAYAQQMANLQYQTYLHAYRDLRAVLGPNVKIGGPSIGTFDLGYLKGFADFCVANGCQINFMTWHELVPDQHDRTIATTHLQVFDETITNNSAYAALDLKERVVNEFMDQDDQYYPAELLADLTYMENGGLNYASHACWNEPSGVSNCSTAGASLDGFLTSTYQPRANWWTAKFFSEMFFTANAQRAFAQATDPRIVARAATISTGPEVLVGYYGYDTTAMSPQSIALTMEHLSAYGYVPGQTLKLTVLRAPNTADASVLSPPLVTSKTVQVSAAGSVQVVLPQIAPHEVLRVTVNP